MNQDNIDYCKQKQFVEEKTPYDIICEMEEYNIESDNYREISKKMITIMTLAMSFIIAAKDPVTASYGVAYALGLDSITEGKSARQVARELGVSSGIISWQKKEAEKYLGIKL